MAGAVSVEVQAALEFLPSGAPALVADSSSVKLAWPPWPPEFQVRSHRAATSQLEWQKLLGRTQATSHDRDFFTKRSGDREGDTEARFLGLRAERSPTRPSR
jgi:hypothetical protein